MTNNKAYIKGYDPEVKMGFNGGYITHLGFVYDGKHIIISREDHIAATKEIGDVPIPDRAFRFVRGSENTTLATVITDQEQLDRIGVAFHKERITLRSRSGGQRFFEDINRPPNAKGPKYYTLFYNSHSLPVNNTTQRFK